MRSTRSSAVRDISAITKSPVRTRSSHSGNKHTKTEPTSPVLSSDSGFSSPPSDFESRHDNAIKKETISSYFPSTPSPNLKRKRNHVSPLHENKNAQGTVKSENVDVKPKPSKMTKQSTLTTIRYNPPPKWRELYDTMKGCERLAQDLSGTITPKVQRFQTLIALMLSSQTKDIITGATIKKLQKELPGGLCLDAILKVDPSVLNEFIKSVGFHNRKTEYIKQTAIVLRDKFDGDIPETIEGMCSLPGVGPKMAHLLSSSAWNKTMGVGVDTHVHRLSNLFKWVPNTPNPEVTRLYLESWLPQDLWHEINWLCVGFGQTFSRKETAIFYKDYQKASRERVKVQTKTEGVEDVKIEDGSQAIPSVVKYWVDLKRRVEQEAHTSSVDQAIESEMEGASNYAKAVVNPGLRDEHETDAVKMESE